ncbi:MAG TPA: hypothetical protein VEZ90_14980 [Blastocatellia bacterium]|nr:hypothetical protein [Blastocatellia bacterium]
MKIRPSQRQKVSDICREELDRAARRIEDRLSEMESKRSEAGHHSHENIRKFYEELADKEWTDSDQECLETVKHLGDHQIKQMMKDAFRHSAVMPLPSFAYLMNLAKKLDPQVAVVPTAHRSNAVSAAERERLANLLDQQLRAAGDEIVSALRLTQPNCELVLQRLEAVQGHIISELSPLV